MGEPVETKAEGPGGGSRVAAGLEDGWEMTPRTPILLPEQPLRMLGAALLVVGILLPSAVAVWRDAERGADIPASGATLRPEMILLPPGKFMMGSPEEEKDRFEGESLHEVTLTKPFALSRTEITQGQYFAVMGERPVETRTGWEQPVCGGWRGGRSARRPRGLARGGQFLQSSLPARGSCPRLRDSR